MTKKSGLADSPFFSSIVPSPPLPNVEKPTVAVFPSIQVNERTLEQANTRTSEQVNGRTGDHLNVRTDEQMNIRTPKPVNTQQSEPNERTVNRKSYDIFDDQAEAIDELARRWSKARKSYITKGQVMRELLDEIIPSKLK